MAWNIGLRNLPRTANALAHCNGAAGRRYPYRTELVGFDVSGAPVLDRYRFDIEKSSDFIRISPDAAHPLVRYTVCAHRMSYEVLQFFLTSLQYLLVQGEIGHQAPQLVILFPRPPQVWHLRGPLS